MRDGQRIDGWAEIESCPEHGADCVAEYDFGMNDATVIKFACGCCVVCCEDGTAAYRTSYRAAEGQARFIVAKGRLDNQAFAV